MTKTKRAQRKQVREMLEEKLAVEKGGPPLKLVNAIVEGVEDGRDAMITMAAAYVWGRPVQRSEISGPEGRPIEFMREQEMTRRQLLQIAAEGEK